MLSCDSRIQSEIVNSFEPYEHWNGEKGLFEEICSSYADPQTLSSNCFRLPIGG
jgi:hypothetical protein